MKMSEWTDTEIRRAVIRELTWDPQIEGTQFDVEVSGRVVTLLGVVDSYSKRMAAQEAAFRVAGVLDVVNEVEVRLPGRLKRTDTEIAQMVRRALDGTDLLSSEQIRSTVSDGWVTLEGTVDHGFQREDAERAVRDLASVHGVTNLVLVDRPSVEPTEVLHEIESVLERRAEHASKHMKVTIKDGLDTLTGAVRTWADKRAIVGATRHLPGVRGVIDHLHLES